MILRSSTIIIFIGLMISSCKDSAIKPSQNDSTPSEILTETNHPNFVSKMELAHQKAKLLENGVVCFNLDMTFGTSKSKFKIFTTPTSSAIRMDKLDGSSTVMINKETYTDADSSRWNSEKFSVYTFQYFFMAPYKFSDNGTIWTKMPDMEIEGKITNRAKLTFESETGDSPNDWYIVHSDPTSHLVIYIGYIVTGGGTSIEEAEKSAHAIKYSEFVQVDGVPMATKWDFFNYDKEKGLGNKIGEGIIKNVEMMDFVDQFNIIHDGTYTKISD